MRFDDFSEGIADDAVQFHDELNPKLFDGTTLKTKVRYKLLKIAQDFVDFIDIQPLRLQDITISGSNAAYTYTPNSDLDLHLIVDIPADEGDMLKELFDAKKNEYNFNHSIKIRNIDVEVYVQPADQKHVSSGIYSVLDDRWLSEPERMSADFSEQDVTDKLNNYTSKVKQALDSSDIELVREISREIKRLRQAGLDREGELSVENIAFKVLRAQGYTERLRDHINDLKDRDLSLEQLGTQ